MKARNELKASQERRDDVRPAKRAIKLTVHHDRLRSTDELDSLVEERVLSLQERQAIAEANVWLGFDRLQSPAFTARVQLVIPGPDLTVDARDHTIRAAIDKALTLVEQRIGERISKRVDRQRRNRSAPGEVRFASIRD